MKKLVNDILNGTLGIFETVREKAKEYVDKGKQNDGAFSRAVHETFSESEEKETFPERIREYVNKGLHAMNVATKDDLDHLRREWEGHNPPSGTAKKRNGD